MAGRLALAMSYIDGKEKDNIIYFVDNENNKTSRLTANRLNSKSVLLCLDPGNRLECIVNNEYVFRLGENRLGIMPCKVKQTYAILGFSAPQNIDILRKSLYEKIYGKKG